MPNILKQLDCMFFFFTFCNLEFRKNFILKQKSYLLVMQYIMCWEREIIDWFCLQSIWRTLDYTQI